MVMRPADGHTCLTGTVWKGVTPATLTCISVDVDGGDPGLLLDLADARPLLPDDDPHQVLRDEELLGRERTGEETGENRG